MFAEPTSLLVFLTLVWFVLFWLIGGILFAIIGLARFLRLNKNRFSCLFTFFSFLAAFGAAQMGIVSAYVTAPRGCLVRESVAGLGINKLLPIIFECSSAELFASAGLFFLLLMAAGLFALFVSRTPERPRDIHGNH